MFAFSDLNRNKQRGVERRSHAREPGTRRESRSQVEVIQRGPFLRSEAPAVSTRRRWYAVYSPRHKTSEPPFTQD